MFTKKIRNGGFTIVELLIVIVVIGILAALVIVTYNGIQKRGENAKTVSSVQAYKKALLQYATENGSYPAVGQYCLGESYPSDTCWRSNWVVSESSTASNALRPYLGKAATLPMPSTVSLDVSGITYSGAIFFNPGTAWTLNGTVHSWWLLYLLQGNGEKCPVGPVVTGSDYPNFNSTPPSSGYSTSRGTLGVECWSPLPDPTKQ